MTQSRRDDIEAVYPLSPVQQGLLFHTLYAPGTSVYMVQGACAIRGPLNVPVFEHAWQRVVDHHAVLRTAFLWEGLKEPLQVVGRRVTIRVEQEDWRDDPAAEQARRLDAFLAADLAREFRLSRAPAMRLALLRLADDAWEFVWTHHHLLLDGWSLPLLFQDLFACYEALSREREPELQRRRPYQDYIAWLRRQDLAEAETYWKRTLSGVSGPTPLTVDQRANGGRDRSGSEQKKTFEVSASLTAELQAFARHHQLTLNTVMQGAWALLLSRYSGEETVVFGSTVSGRPVDLPGAESMLGMFINTLPVRLDVRHDASVVAWLKTIQDAQVEMRRYEYSPLSQVQTWSEASRGRSLFDSLYVFENYPADLSQGQHVGALQLENFQIASPTGFPLSFLVGPGSSLSLQISYDSALFEAASIDRMAGHVQSVLEHVVAHPRRLLRDVPLLTGAERRQVVEWNETRVDYPGGLCLHELFEAQVERTPDSVAVVYDHEHLTYRELNRRANQVAHHLRGLGVGPDVPVGILVERSTELVVGLLGILKAGGAYLPLDADYPRQRLTQMMDDAGAPVLLTQDRLRETWSASAAHVVCLDGDRETLDRASADNPRVALRPENLAYVIFTSGSTGRPKGAMNTHAGICNRLLWMQQVYRLTGEDRVLQKTPISFDVSVWEFFAPLLAGARLVMAQPGGHRDPAYLVKLINEQDITLVHFVPSMLQIFLDEADVTTCRSVKRVFCSGEALPFNLQQRCFARLEAAEIHNLYGPTEASIEVTAWACERNGDGPAVPIGKPIANTQIYLLDTNLEPTPVGVPGELHIGGIGLARGYLGRPELTAERFVPSPFGEIAGARLYKTGDLARYLESGDIEYLGRIDHQVKVRGSRVELGEIESTIAQHPGVREAVVVVREEREGDQRLIAYLVLDRSVADEPETLTSAVRQLLKERLPEYMMPSAFVMLEALPLSPSGKTDRRALPAPEAFRSDASRPYVAPRTLVEEELARLVSQVLGVERMSVFDDFFELGGHSLLAMQAISRIRATFHVELPLRDLFETRTVAGLAKALERAQREPSVPPVTPVAREGALPLSYSQEGLWFLDQLAPGNAFYNIPGAVRLRGPLGVDALTRAFEEIVNRHEVLRTTFPTVAGQATQEIGALTRLTIPLVDLSGLAAADRDAQAQRLAAAEAQRGFDLSRGPLLRVRLVRLGVEDHVLLVTLHHIVADGWSMGILVRELATLYEAFSTGGASPLAAPSIQYADYAHWQRRWLQGEVLARHLAHWKKELSDLPVLQLPMDRPRPAVKTFRGSMHAFALPSSVADGVKSLMRQEGATLFMTCLAAFQALLARYAGQDDVVVGSPIANRTRRETEGLIGFFVNTLVLRADLSGNPSFRTLLGRVREATLRALAHGDLPFEKLVEALQPARDLSREPLFQVLFVLQNAAPASGGPPGGLHIEPMESPTETAKFDLTLFITEEREGLRGAFEYSTDLFDAETIRRMAQSFGVLLHAMVAEPDRSLSELPLLALEDQRRLAEWNDTEADFPREACVHQLIEAQVARTPEAVAVVFDRGDLTYRELNERGNQLARYLRHRGVGPDAVVGICMERSADMIVAVLGVLKAGAAYVPLDPAYPGERLAAMLEDARVPLLLTQERLLPSLPQGLAEPVCLDADWPRISREDGANPSHPVTPDQRVYAIFTSGSTGRPKLAAVYHRGFANLMHWYIEEFGIRDADRTLLLSSFNFDLTQKNLFAPLMTGGRLYLADPDVYDPVLLRGAIDQNRITLVNCTPSAFYPLVDQADSEVCRQLRSLRHVFLGGEPISVARLRGWTGSPECHAEIVNTYGPTECTDICAYHRLARPERSLESPVPIGRPIPNVKLYVLDPSLAVLPIGAPGELCVTGAGVGEGYLNDAELTARRFVPNPFSPGAGERLYRTGDLTRYLPNGDIEYLGRIDHQVKIRGYRIELGEVETALARHPAVREVVVLAREDDPDERRLVAYVVAREPEPGSSTAALPPETAALPPEVELRAYLRARLPDYMVPSAFVTLAALPLTPNGKLDRRALPQPDRTQRRAASAFAPPTTPQETVLADILAELLKLERVGIHDNFFELGGDSILAIQMVARANRAGLRLSPGQLFQYQTVAELATVVGAPVDVTAEQGIVEGPLPLTPVQRTFFARTPVDPHYFNHAFLLEVRRPLDPSVLEAAVAQLLVHHDALRMRFERGESGWQQTNAGLDQSPVASVFLRQDLSALSEPEQKRRVEATAAELQASLDLARGPLIRVAYFDLGPTRAARLLMIIHHLVIDGVSWRILMDDFLAAYQQRSRGEVAAPPAKTTSFQGWARRLPDYARSEPVRCEADYWLSDRHARIKPMPLDFPGGVNTAATLDSVVSSLDAEETRALLQDVSAAFRTQINDALLTALVGAFSAWTGEPSLLIELEGHGREGVFADVDISRTVGWFTSLYPVRLELTDPDNPGRALRSIRALLDRVPNRGMGYGLLRELSDDEQIRLRLQAHPAPEVTFNYHGHVDQFGGEAPVVAAPESPGPTQSPRQTRTQVLDVVAGVVDGALNVAWTYNTNLHRRSTIEQLARGFSGALRALIAASRDPDARAYTPSDFPLTRLSQQQLDQVLRKVSKRSPRSSG